MLSSSDLANIAEVCNTIGNQATDDAGFVPVRNLLSRFNADIRIRPLLVEGMLASTRRRDGERQDNRWVVLIDSEKYPYTQTDVDNERSSRPLPHRMRNTIAHELVHALAFRSSEFGVRLNAKIDTKQSLREFVDAVEEKTEQLSPLLLWSEKGLGLYLRGRKDTLSLPDLLHVVEHLGISRYVLINRLLLIRPASDSNGFLFAPALRNLAVGIGIWDRNGAALKGWPIFWNFDPGNVPSFLWKLSGRDSVPANELFVDAEFGMLGGTRNSTEFETSAGTKAAPTATKSRIQVTIEEGLRRPAEEFLYVVRGNAPV
jgi:hypothetical protein